MMLAECEREYGAGGRTADARQRHHLYEISGEYSTVMIADERRAAVQMARAGVVAESAPVMQQLVDRRIRQCRYVGKARHEALVIGNDSGDLRLLQHDLRRPHSIRRGLALPRQILAAVAVPPGQQIGGETQGRNRVGRQVRYFISHVAVITLSDELPQRQRRSSSSQP